MTLEEMMKRGLELTREKVHLEKELKKIRKMICSQGESGEYLDGLVVLKELEGLPKITPTNISEVQHILNDNCIATNHHIRWSEYKHLEEGQKRELRELIPFGENQMSVSFRKI